MSKEKTGNRESKPAGKEESLASRLGRTFFFIGFLATIVTAATAYTVSRHYLRQEAQQRLEGVRTLLEESLTNRLERTRRDLAVQAASPAIAQALDELALGRNLLEEELGQILRKDDVTLDEGFTERLRRHVRRHFEETFLAALRNNLPGVESETVALADFLQPDLRTNLLLNQFLPDDAVTDPALAAVRRNFGKTSYARAYDKLHPRFAAQGELLEDVELYLVDADGFVVYATEKLIDYHANLLAGPQQGSPLARVFDAAMSRALLAEDSRAGQAPPIVVSAMEPYLPALGVPQLFLSAPVVSADGIPRGAIIYRMPFSAFNVLTTFRDNRAAAGLGQTGEAFLLTATDSPETWTMLTEPRGFEQTREQQDAAAVSAAGQEAPGSAESAGDPQALPLIERITPPTVTGRRQPVDLSAFLDEQNHLRTGAQLYTSYREVPVLGTVASLDLPGLDWAVLVEQATSEALAPAGNLAIALAICALVVFLLIGLLSLWAAGSFTRPLKALEDAMQNAAAGNEKARAEVVGNDELARLAETFNRMNSERVRDQKKLNVDNDRLQSNIEELLIVAADASEGKLGVRARVTEGQLGNIASALNIMLENVGNFIEQIRVASGRVASASVEIATTAGDLSQGVTDQNAQIESTTETVRQLDEGAGETVKATEDAAEAANLTRQAANRGARSVREVRETMNQIREKVQVNAQKIKRLGERSMEVSGIVKSISDISAQTDMLAFNASVESERGAEGRGFNMVADRVRDLAERTKQATAEIERLVSSIQSETAEAVLQMEKMTEEVESGSARVQNAETSLRNIVDSSKTSSELVEQIREIAGRQREQSQTVLQAMNSLTEIAVRAADKVGQNRQTSDQLADLSSDLNAQIGEFNTDPEQPQEIAPPARLSSSSR